MAIPSLDPNYFDLLKCFHSHGVRYLLIGGYAVIHHGYDRLTHDMDLWIAADTVNAPRISAALVEYGYSASSVPPSIFEKSGTMFRVGGRNALIELLTQPSDVEFEECWRDRNVIDIQGVPVNVISLHHLRQNKLASGRLKDLADLEELPAAEPPSPSEAP